MRKCDLNIQSTLLLVKEMLDLADRGDVDREDSGCGVMYGVLRDSAYKIRQLAEKEKQSHINKGWWNDSICESSTPLQKKYSERK